jgi:hypothetical protein
VNIDRGLKDWHQPGSEDLARHLELLVGHRLDTTGLGELCKLAHFGAEDTALLLQSRVARRDSGSAS